MKCENIVKIVTWSFTEKGIACNRVRIVDITDNKIGKADDSAQRNRVGAIRE